MKEEKISAFLKSLGDVKTKGFKVQCLGCGSFNVVAYDDTGCGSEYTGCWGDAGIKCIDCGNAAEIMSM